MSDLADRLEARSIDETLDGQIAFADDLYLAASRLREMEARDGIVEQMLERLRDVLRRYHTNGPSWTGKDGHEYEDASYVVALCEDLVAIATPPPPEPKP